MIKKTENLYIKTFAVVWPYALIVSLGLWVGFSFTSFNPWEIVLSFILGTLVSVMMMSFHYRSVMKQVDIDYTRLRSLSIRNYFIRFAFYGLVLAIAHFNEGLMMIPVFAGLTSFKVALIISAIIFKEGETDVES